MEKCPCGGQWLYVSVSAYLQYTSDWAVDSEGNILFAEDAVWSDCGSSEAEIGTYFECSGCGLQIQVRDVEG